MRLRARIEPGGKTTTRISVPNEVVAALNAGKNGQDSLTKPGYSADACASAEPEVMPVKLVCPAQHLASVNLECQRTRTSGASGKRRRRPDTAR